MSSRDPELSQPTPLASLPRLDDLRRAGEGFDAEQVRSAFDAFQRHVTQLQAQLRVLQAAGPAAAEPSGHAVRMDALHLIRAAAEFADALERDSQTAAASQLAKVEEEIRHRHQSTQAREDEIEEYRKETERQRQEIITAARNEARELLANAQRDASQELREAEARGNRLLEQARHQATELTNAARAEVEGTLEWARAQAAAVMARAQQGAEQLLGAAGLSTEEVRRVSNAIVAAAEQATDAARSPGGVSRRPEAPAGPATAAPAPAAAAPAVAPTPVSPSPGGQTFDDPEQEDVEEPDEDLEPEQGDGEESEQGGWNWSSGAPQGEADAGDEGETEGENRPWRPSS